MDLWSIFAGIFDVPWWYWSILIGLCLVVIAFAVSMLLVGIVGLALVLLGGYVALTKVDP